MEFVPVRTPCACSPLADDLKLCPFRQFVDGLDPRLMFVIAIVEFAIIDEVARFEHHLAIIRATYKFSNDRRARCSVGLVSSLDKDFNHFLLFPLWAFCPLKNDFCISGSPSIPLC